MVLLITLLAAFVLCSLLVMILVWVKSPIYRVKPDQVERLLQWVLLGQATENDWRVFCDLPIAYDALLEDIRQQCEIIDEAHLSPSSHSPYLFSPPGMTAIREQLQRLEDARNST